MVVQGHKLVPINFTIGHKGGEILGFKAVSTVAEAQHNTNGKLEVVDIFNEENPYYLPV